MTQCRQRPPRLLAAGYLTLDMVVRDLAKGDYWHSAGGTCGNVSIFTSALGVEVSLLAQIGKDRRAQRILRDMDAARVDTLNVEHNSAVRTPGIVELIRGTTKGEHRFTHRCPLCESRLPKQSVVSKRVADSVAKNINQFDAYFFDRVTSATISLARAAHEAGLIVMFEPPSIPRTSRAKIAAALSDIVKISRRAGHKARDWGLCPNGSTKFIIETLGSEGTRFQQLSPRGAGEWVHLPAFTPTLIKDTAGAGDWLTAGLLADLLLRPHELTEDSVRDLIKYGQRLSAISISYDGPNGALTALGATNIKRAASGGHYLPINHDTCTLRTEGQNASVKLANHCELCLSEPG